MFGQQKNQSLEGGSIAEAIHHPLKFVLFIIPFSEIKKMQRGKSENENVINNQIGYSLLIITKFYATLS